MGEHVGRGLLEWKTIVLVRSRCTNPKHDGVMDGRMRRRVACHSGLDPAVGDGTPNFSCEQG